MNRVHSVVSNLMIVHEMSMTVNARSLLNELGPLLLTCKREACSLGDEGPKAFMGFFFSWVVFCCFFKKYS